MTDLSLVSRVYGMSTKDVLARRGHLIRSIARSNESPTLDDLQLIGFLAYPGIGGGDGVDSDIVQLLSVNSVAHCAARCREAKSGVLDGVCRLGLALGAAAVRDVALAAYVLGSSATAAVESDVRTATVLAIGSAFATLRDDPMATKWLSQAHDRACESGDRLLEALSLSERARIESGTEQRRIRLAAARKAERAGLRALSERLSGTSRSARGTLSDRKIEVLSYVSLGYSDTETGAILDLSAHTVANHVRRIRQRIGAATRAEAVAWAVTNRLVSVPA